MTVAAKLKVGIGAKDPRSLVLAFLPSLTLFVPAPAEQEHAPDQPWIYGDCITLSSCTKTCTFALAAARILKELSSNSTTNHPCPINSC